MLVAVVGLGAVGCAQHPWNPASGRAELSVMDGTGRDFAGGTCDYGGTDSGGEFFLLVIGRPSPGEADGGSLRRRTGEPGMGTLEFNC